MSKLYENVLEQLTIESNSSSFNLLSKLEGQCLNSAYLWVTTLFTFDVFGCRKK